MDAYGYKDWTSGPTGGMYVYIPLGTLRLADIVPSWDDDNFMNNPIEGRVQATLVELWDCSAVGGDLSIAQWLFVTPGSQDLYPYWARGGY